MALFVDRDLTTIDDLAGIDHNILAIAAVEGIDVTKKIELSQALLVQDLSCAMARESGETDEHAVGQVASTRGLRLCHAFKALELIYQEAFASQGLERYDRCRESFRNESRRALLAEFESGLSICDEPLPRPQAPLVTLGAGIGPSGDQEYSVAWLNQRGQESMVGAVRLLDNPTGQSITVTPIDPPVHATGWRVYASLPGERPVRQDGDLQIQDSWTSSQADLVDLGANDGGQKGDIVLRLSPRTNRLWRG